MAILENASAFFHIGDFDLFRVLRIFGDLNNKARFTPLIAGLARTAPQWVEPE